MGEPKSAEVMVLQPSERLPRALTPMDLLEKATEKGADVTTLERLMDLQLRWEANEARKAFVAAKTAFYREAPEIIKNKHVGFDTRGGDQTSYWHATLDHIVEVAAPVLAKHGLTHAWETTQSEKGIEVACVLTHLLGHSQRVSLVGPPDNTGKKGAIQQIGSTITFLERYTFMAVTGLAAKNQDNDGEMTNGDFISPEQVDEINRICDETGADKARFCQLMKVDSIAAIPAKRFKAALAALRWKADEK